MVASGGTLFVGAMSAFGIFQGLEGEIHDFFFRIRASEAKDDKILIVTIDESDLRTVGTWPIPDKTLAQVIEQLNQYHPRVIGLDLYRNVPEEPGHQELLEVFQTTPNLIGVENILSPKIAPPPVLKDRNQVALTNVVLDLDLHIRRGLLSLEDPQSGAVKLTLAARTALMYLEQDGITLQKQNPQTFQLGHAEITPLRPGDVGYDHWGGVQILMNWRGGPSAFERVSMVDVLDGRVNPELIRDRLVFVGPISDTADFFATPYNHAPRGMAGILVHANLASQLINSALSDRPLITSPSRWGEIWWIFVAACIGAGGSWGLELHNSKSRWQCLGLRTLLSCLALSGGILLIAYGAFLMGHLLPAMSTLMALASSAIITTNLYKQQKLEATNAHLRLANQQLEERSNTLEQKVEERTLNLRIAKDEADRANRLKDQFLANISHEIRTPLNAILGTTEILQERIWGDINEQQNNGLKVIEKSGSHLLSLITDILNIAKIESGNLDLDLAPISVNEICRSSLIFVKQQAFKKRIEIRSDLAPDLPNLIVDSVRIRQVLINLLNNAVKFTPRDGKIILSSFLSPASGAASAVMVGLAVTDTGIGIAPEHIDDLFRPFAQIDNSLTRSYEGTGLGLSLVKSIVQLHGGQVTVTSEPGVGSCFTITLPCVLPAQCLSDQSLDDSLPASAPTDPLVRPEQRGEPIRALPLSPIAMGSPLIVMIEKQRAHLLSIKNYLSAKGYCLQVFNSYAEIQDRHLAQDLALLLMEISIPDMGGLDEVRYVREMSQCTNVPIITLAPPKKGNVVTYGSLRQQCLDVGANEHFDQPIKLKKLEHAVRRFLD